MARDKRYKSDINLSQRTRETTWIKNGYTEKLKRSNKNNGLEK